MRMRRGRGLRISCACSVAGVLLLACSSPSDAPPATPAPTAPQISRVAIDRSADTLLIGDQHVLTATAHATDNSVVAGASISWSSSNSAVASISSAGLLQGWLSGTTSITATAGGVSASIPVAVGGETPTLTMEQVPGTTRTGLAAALTLRARARDAFNRPIVGAAVSWTMNQSVGWLFPTATVTGSDGGATAQWVAGTTPGSSSMTLAFRGRNWNQMASVTPVVEPTTSYNAINTNFAHSGSANAYRIDVTPLTDPPGTYYSAVVWTGGYTGLIHGTSGNRQVQFSAWNNANGSAAVLDSSSSHLNCYAFGNEGTGVACVLPYPWQTGRTYRFEVRFTTVSGNTEVDGYVTDMTTGTQTYVGKLRQAGVVAQTDYFTTFVEDFIQDSPHCLATAMRRYRIANAAYRTSGAFTALTSASVARYSPMTACANVDWSLANGGLEIWLGASVPRNPAESIPNAVTVPSNP